MNDTESTAVSNDTKPGTGADGTTTALPSTIDLPRVGGEGGMAGVDVPGLPRAGEDDTGGAEGRSRSDGEPNSGTVAQVQRADDDDEAGEEQTTKGPPAWKGPPPSLKGQKNVAGRLRKKLEAGEEIHPDAMAWLAAFDADDHDLPDAPPPPPVQLKPGEEEPKKKRGRKPKDVPTVDIPHETPAAASTSPLNLLANVNSHQLSEKWASVSVAIMRKVHSEGWPVPPDELTHVVIYTATLLTFEQWKDKIGGVNLGKYAPFVALSPLAVRGVQVVLKRAQDAKKERARTPTPPPAPETAREAPIASQSVPQPAWGIG